MNIKRHIFEFIVDHHTRWNYLPTRAEVRGFFSALVADVDLHLEQLEREGLLSLSADGKSLTLAPLYGTTKSIKLQNGSRLDSTTGDHRASEGAITVDLRAAGIRLDGDLFARVVCDDSMLDAGVRCGDVAIFRTGQPARGDVVAVEKSGELVLRRYLSIKGIPHLLAENSTHPDLKPAFDTPVHGVLCCLISPRFAAAKDEPLPPTDKVNYVQEDGTSYDAAPLQLSAPSSTPSKRRRIAADKRATVTPQAKPFITVVERRQAKTNNRKDWPSPPTGITLNEADGTAYVIHKRPHTCNEQPDGRARPA